MTQTIYDDVTLDGLEYCAEPYNGITGGDYAVIYETCLDQAAEAVNRVLLWESWAAIELEKQQSAKGAEYGG